MIKGLLKGYSISKVSVIGAGQMGSGIAFVSLFKGDYKVKLIDISESNLSKANSYIMSLLDKNIKKGVITDSDKERLLQNLTFSTYFEDCKDSELVVEAINEVKETKFELFKNISNIVSDTAILASNTSSISISEISNYCNNPKRVIGMHFFNPVPVLNLVEIINADKTASETTEKVKEICKKIGKTSVISKDSYGFITNRILMPWINEAIICLENGIATREDIDTAMKLGTNVPMGPLTLADFIGLDTCLSILEIMQKGLNDNKFKPSKLLIDMVSKGYYGRKSGKGFYDYNK